jgi:hypothetical protein
MATINKDGRTYLKENEKPIARGNTTGSISSINITDTTDFNKSTTTIDFEQDQRQDLNSVNDAKYTWLRENGLGDLIKNEITVSFGRNEDNKASQYAILAKGQGFEPVQKLKVEPMTLKALVRERLESGQEMPSDLFNVFAGNRTKVTRSK